MELGVGVASGVAAKRECDGGGGVSYAAERRPRFRRLLGALFGVENVFPLGLEIPSSGDEGPSINLTQLRTKSNVKSLTLKDKLKT